MREEARDVGRGRGGRGGGGRRGVARSVEDDGAVHEVGAMLRRRTVRGKGCVSRPRARTHKGRATRSGRALLLLLRDTQGVVEGRRRERRGRRREGGRGRQETTRTRPPVSHTLLPPPLKSLARDRQRSVRFQGLALLICTPPPKPRRPLPKVADARSSPPSLSPPLCWQPAYELVEYDCGLGGCVRGGGHVRGEGGGGRGGGGGSEGGIEVGGRGGGGREEGVERRVAVGEAEG